MVKLVDRLPVPIRINEAKALSDEIRLFILDLLTKEPKSVHEISEELKKRGMYKNINTVRYHLQILKDAGLIELVRTEEIKGGVLKYYASKRKVYTFEVPKGIEKDLQPLVETITEPLKKIILEVIEKHRDLILTTSKKLKPCPYCVTKHFAEYVILEAIRIATGKAIEDKAVREELAKFKFKEEESEE